MKMEEVEDFEFFLKYTHLRTQYADCQKQFNKSPDAALKKLRVIYARESLEWMARVLAFVETSPEEANDPENQTLTFLDYEVHDKTDPLKVSPALRHLADSDQKRAKIWSNFLSNKDVGVVSFERSLARLKFIRDFLEESAVTINSALDVKGVVKIKGSKSVSLKADLLRHVRLNPMTGKVLLLGEPGGGKGITASYFHSLSIEEIRKNDHLLKETIETVADKLVSIFMLPKAQEILSAPEKEEEVRASKLLAFVKAQLQGTMWWRWDMPENDKHKPPGPSPWDCRSDGLCPRVPSNFANILDGELEKEPCGSCPLKSHVEILRPKFKPLNLIQNTKSIRLSIQFMAHYLARLFYAVFGLGNNPKPKDRWNYIQVLCGVLANQGPEFISSMRKLFGTAEKVEMPLPGLFQTASYMAGTIFLDEIADCPIKIQDNLLAPLEEKKVVRLGWESIEEDVSNIRIVAATYKDLRVLVKQYRATLDSDTPRGFRPDLLSRLALFPPVYPSSVTDYLLYDNKNHMERNTNRMEFVSIMHEILCKKTGDVKHPDDDLRRRFLGDLFDTVDKYIKDTMAMMDFPEARFSEIRKDLVKKVTTRLFVGVIDALALAEKQAEHFAAALNEKTEKQPTVKTKEPDIKAITEIVLKAREQKGSNDVQSQMENRLNGFYSQTEEQIKKLVWDLGIDEKKGSDIKKALLNGFALKIDRVIKMPDNDDFNRRRETFLNARMSEIIRVNLPKLLNFIVTSDA
ncbi:MAG: sigma-54 factor interaction domain-containing protein [Deltaproteobacteria bacterium]|nr:sigma-54 factor interaction domain-containing protein [Deltaproteobacteria bacterium]